MLPSGTSANKRFLQHVRVGAADAMNLPEPRKTIEGGQQGASGLHVSNHVANLVIPLRVPEMPFQTCLNNVGSALGTHKILLGIAKMLNLYFRRLEILVSPLTYSVPLSLNPSLLICKMGINAPSQGFGRY